MYDVLTDKKILVPAMIVHECRSNYLGNRGRRIT